MKKIGWAPGFEPGNAEIKTLCLTAWRRPIAENLLLSVEVTDYTLGRHRLYIDSAHVLQPFLPLLLWQTLQKQPNRCPSFAQMFLGPANPNKHGPLDTIHKQRVANHWPWSLANRRLF